MESLLHADELCSGRTTDATTLSAEKVRILIWPLDRAQKFRGVFVGYFPWSSMESLLHADDVHLGRTTDSTAVLAEKVHNFWSNRWIAPKFLEDFL
jgi:hypothetical protein